MRFTANQLSALECKRDMQTFCLRVRKARKCDDLLAIYFEHDLQHKIARGGRMTEHRAYECILCALEAAWQTLVSEYQ